MGDPAYGYDPLLLVGMVRFEMIVKELPAARGTAAHLRNTYENRWGFPIPEPVQALAKEIEALEKR
jgi:hypothetical protein